MSALSSNSSSISLFFLRGCGGTSVLTDAMAEGELDAAAAAAAIGTETAAGAVDASGT